MGTRLFFEFPEGCLDDMIPAQVNLVYICVSAIQMFSSCHGNQQVGLALCSHGFLQQLDNLISRCV